MTTNKMATKDEPWLSTAIRDLLIDSDLTVKSNPDLSEEKIIENVMKRFNEDDGHGIGLEIRELISKEVESDVIYEIDDVLKRFKNNFDPNSTSNFNVVEDEVVKRVSLSGNYKITSKNLLENVKKVTEKLEISNYDVNSLKNSRKNQFPVEKTMKSDDKRIISLYSDVDSLNTTFDFSNFDNFDTFPSLGNLGNFVYLEWEKFVNLTEKCGKSNPDIEDRINSMNLLIKSINPQFIDKSSLEKLIPVLHDALTSGNLFLVENCLKFYWKIISSTFQSAVIDLFIDLLDFVKNEFVKNEFSNFFPVLENGISVENVNCRILLMIFRVIHRFLMNIVKDWVRFPNKEIEMMVGKTLNLVGIGKMRGKSGKTKGKMAVVTPLHLLALLDPSGKWLKRWMKSGFGRGIILEKFNWLKLVSFLEGWLSGNIGNFEKCLIVSLKREKICDFGDFSSSKNEDFQKISPKSGISGSKSENFQKISPKNEISTSKTENFQKFLSKTESFQKIPPKTEISTNFDQTWNFSKQNLQFSHCYLTLEILGIFHLYNKTFQFPPSNSFLTFLTQHLYTTCCCTDNNFKKYCLGHCISNILTNIIKNTHNLTPLTLTNDVITLIATPLGLKSPNEFDLLTCCKLLTACLENENCCKLMLESGNVEKIEKFMTKLMQDKKISVCGEIFVSFLRLSSRIYADYRFVDLFLETRFPEVLYERLKGLGESEERGEEQVRCLAQFAVTPKGLMRLVEIGAVKDCVPALIGDCQDLQSENNLLLNIILLNSAITILDQHGFFISTVTNFWQQCESIDTQPHLNQQLSLENIDRITNSQLDNLLPYISSFTTTTSLLQHSKNQIFTWPPRSLEDFLKCVVFADDFERRENEIFNVEKFEFVCLRLLSGLISSLDSNLILQNWFHYQEKILKFQLENKIEDGGRIIIDENSLLRHNILVKSRCVGGPNEKMAPIYDIPRFGASVSYPVLNDNPTSDYYLPRRLSRERGVDERNPLSSFLSETETAKISSQTWIRMCWQAFQECLINDYQCEQILFNAMEKIVELQCSALSNEEKLSENSGLTNDADLSDVYKIGFELTLKYGKYLGLINFDDESKTQLTRFLTIYQQIWIKKSETELFPWLPATIYLMSSADYDRSLRYFNRIKLLNPRWAWLAFPDVDSESNLKFTWICHHVEEMLITELPCVYSAFQLGFASVSGIILVWLRNSFWNYLDWDEICNFVMLFSTFGVNYIIFYITAIFSHLQQDILIKAQRAELNTFLLEEPLHGFKLKTYFPYLNYLSEKYNLTLTNSIGKYLKIK